MYKLPDLSTLLTYKNPLVIKRFQRLHPAHQDQAESLFQDVLKYLWLCQKHAQDCDNNKSFSIVMHKEMIMIDEMWHTFILITKDYSEFCQQYFGRYLHHVPETGEETQAIEIDAQRFTTELAEFLSYVYDHLGENTVRSWFKDYVT